MTAGPTATAGPVPAVAGPAAIPRRRPVAGSRPRTSERVRTAASRAGWYATKWFRQMLNVLAHPTEAFWELKRTGDWASVPALLVCAIGARMLLMQFMSFHFVFQNVDKTNWNFERIVDQVTRILTLGIPNFIYGSNPEDVSIFQEGLRIIVPFVTWCLAQYAIAVIFYGEGSLKNIMVGSAFSLTPFILFSWPAALILTNSTTIPERSLYFSVAWIVNLWVFILLFTCIRVIHDFSFKRALSTYILSLITVVIIWALLALVYALTSNTYEFFYEIFYELTTR